MSRLKGKADNGLTVVISLSDSVIRRFTAHTQRLGHDSWKMDRTVARLPCEIQIR